jgi:hypothetical protein
MKNLVLNAVGFQKIYLIFKNTFPGTVSKKVADADGVVISEMAGSTTKMNKEQFGEYIDRITQWAAEFLQIAIPSPDEKLTLEL